MVGAPVHGGKYAPSTHGTKLQHPLKRERQKQPQKRQRQLSSPLGAGKPAEEAGAHVTVRTFCSRRIQIGQPQHHRNCNAAHPNRPPTADPKQFDHQNCPKHRRVTEAKNAHCGAPCQRLPEDAAPVERTGKSKHQTFGDRLLEMGGCKKKGDRVPDQPPPDGNTRLE